MDGLALTSLSSDFFYGWDLLFRTVESRIVKKADVLMVFAHFLLTKHCSFRCVGIGDDKNLPDDQCGSELLPEQWNRDSSKYSLRYIHDKVLYLLLAHVTGDVLVVNLLDVNTKNVSNICLTPQSLVTDLKGNIAKMLPTAGAIVDRFHRELCEPVFAANARDVTLPQRSNEPYVLISDPLSDEPRRHPNYVPHNLDPNSHNLPDIGRGDLDPLGSGMGNLYPFPRNPAPVNPPMPGQGSPNPDHAQPPDWNPDQYM